MMDMFWRTLINDSHEVDGKHLCYQRLEHGDNADYKRLLKLFKIVGGASSSIEKTTTKVDSNSSDTSSGLNTPTSTEAVAEIRSQAHHLLAKMMVIQMSPG